MCFITWAICPRLWIITYCHYTSHTFRVNYIQPEHFVKWQRIQTRSHFKMIRKRTFQQKAKKDKKNKWDFGTKIYQMKNIYTNIFVRSIQFSVSGIRVHSRLMEERIVLLNSTWCTRKRVNFSYIRNNNMRFVYFVVVN